MEHKEYEIETKTSLEFEFTPENIRVIRELAKLALEPGLNVAHENEDSDYVDKLLPA